ncbi:MAG TPA: S8 family serine peptidase [Phycisphaerae bacterium]|nr:S8 family serine peptidase [Phycisphaerae bacterium]
MFSNDSASRTSVGGGLLAAALLAAFGAAMSLAQQSAPEADEKRFPPAVQSARDDGRAAGMAEPELPSRTLHQIKQRKHNRQAWERKVDSAILDRLDILNEENLLAAGRRPMAALWSTSSVAIDADARLRVECKVADDRVFDAALLASYGGTLVTRTDGYGFVVAWIPAEQIAAVSQRADVLRIMQMTPTWTDLGSQTTEGDVVHAADIVRNIFGFDGTGQTVGVISDGVDNLAFSQGLGDLGAVAVDIAGSGDEGTAMLEIVADLAPGAALRFAAGGGGTANMVNAINTLAGNGCTVITDDLPNVQEPLFETGPIAQAKINAFNAGIFYTASAGNRAREHHEANFNCTNDDVPIGGAGTFDCPHVFNGTSVALPFTFNGGNATFALQWAEPFGGAGIDLDLYILDGAQNNILASSTDGQSGSDDPIEICTFSASAGTTGWIVIDHFDGGIGETGVFFDLRAFGTAFGGAFNMPPGSVNGASRQTQVYAAAASFWNNPTVVEAFSSRGPIRQFFPVQLTRMKPDGTAVDGVTVTGAGCFGCGMGCPPIPPTGCSFFGTSAATPHVAGLAALLLEANPAFTPTQVATRLNNNAIDIDAPGQDNNSGFGLLNILRAVADCNTDLTPPIIAECSFNGGTLDPVTCSLTRTYTVLVTDNRCLQAENVTSNASITSGQGTLDASIVTFTQLSATEVLIQGSVTVSAVSGCPVVVSISVTATDCCDNVANLTCDSGEIVDITPPVFTFCTVVGGEVDDNCEYLMPFSASITDSCCINVSDVGGSLAVITNNAVLSNVTANFVQVNQGRVDLNGTVLVSQLTSCPATIRLTLGAVDCCGNPAQQCVAEADVVDLIPPVIVCPPDITLDRGDKICNDDVQNWLDSATATDNCDTDVEIVNDAPPCGFACGTTTLVTWTATDDCGNQSQCSASITIKPCPIGTPSQKGTVLIFPNVEVKWNLDGTVRQDTFISLSNDQTQAVHVNLFFVNGDDAIPGEPGCNYVKVNADLTKSQPIFFSAATGLPFGISGFKLLDPGPPPGRPDPEDPTARVLRGFLVVVATNPLGNEIRWNHLHGEATIVDYARSAAWEYAPWAFQNRCVPEGDELLDCILFDAAGVCCDAIVIPGNLDFDAFQLDLAPGRLLLNFIAANATAFSGAGRVVKHDTDLTLLPMNQDLRQDGLPHRTKVDALLWNGNEISFAAVPRCINCWDQRLLSAWSAIFLRHNLQTDAGRARWDGVASSQCPGSTPAALLGVANKILTFDATDVTYSGANLQGLGSEKGNIRYDPLEPPEENAGGQ